MHHPELDNHGSSRLVVINAHGPKLADGKCTSAAPNFPHDNHGEHDTVTKAENSPFAIMK